MKTSHSQSMQYISSSVGEPPHQVDAIIVQVGKDLAVIVGGGSSYHIGAVAVSYPHLSTIDDKKISSTTSVLTITGHKEDEIVHSAARKMAKELNCSVVISAGLHINDASENDIQVLVSNFNQVIDQITQILQQNSERL